MHGIGSLAMRFQRQCIHSELCSTAYREGRIRLSCLADSSSTMGDPLRLLAALVCEDKGSILLVDQHSRRTQSQLLYPFSGPFLTESESSTSRHISEVLFGIPNLRVMRSFFAQEYPRWLHACEKAGKVTPNGRELSQVKLALVVRTRH